MLNHRSMNYGVLRCFYRLVLKVIVGRGVSLCWDRVAGGVLVKGLRFQVLFLRVTDLNKIHSLCN